MRAIRHILLATSGLIIAPGIAPGIALAQEEVLAPDEIIVTANRQDTLLSRTPLAITAVTGDTLLRSGVSNPTQLPDLAPSIAIDRGSAAGLQITIRGVSSADNTEKGDPSAGFVVDGVFLARSQAQEVSFFDLERVEVLRGPQGTLYGRNTTAGLVSLITARPQLGEFSGRVDATYGNYNTMQGTGVLNVPLGDNVALRGALNYDRRDSFLTPGISPFDLDPFKDNLSGRLSLLWEPGDHLSVLVRADYTKFEGSPGALSTIGALFPSPITVPADGQLGPNLVLRDIDPRTARTLSFAERQQSLRDNSTWGIQADITYDLTDTLTLNYIGSYRELDRDEQFTGLSGRLRASGAFVTSIQLFDGTYDQTSQELRLAYAGDSLQVQTGVYFFEENSDIRFLLLGTQGFQPGQRGFVFGFPQSTTSDSFALFGQGTLDLTPELRATAGIRWTRDNKERVGATIFHANIGDPLDFTTAVQPGSTNPRNVTDSLNNAAVEYSEITWRAGLEYDANDSTLIYANVATGYKAGGFNDGCLAGAQNCNGSAITSPEILFYDPETLIAYEAGIKTRLFDNAVRLSASAFHYDYTDLQLTQLTLIAGAPAQRTLNAGAAKVDGIELEAIVRPAENHRFDVAVAWLNARFTDYEIDSAPPLTAQFAGRSLDRAPEWTANIAYNFTMPLGNGGDVQFNARTRFSDSYAITAPAIRAQFIQPSFTRTDLSLTYNAPDDRFYVQGFARNLENELTVGFVGVVANFGAAFDDGSVQLGDPRTYGVRVGFQF